MDSAHPSSGLRRAVRGGPGARERVAGVEKGERELERVRDRERSWSTLRLASIE